MIKILVLITLFFTSLNAFNAKKMECDFYNKEIQSLTNQIMKIMDLEELEMLPEILNTQKNYLTKYIALDCAKYFHNRRGAKELDRLYLKKLKTVKKMIIFLEEKSNPPSKIEKLIKRIEKETHNIFNNKILQYKIKKNLKRTYLEIEKIFTNIYFLIILCVIFLYSFVAEIRAYDKYNLDCEVFDQKPKPLGFIISVIFQGLQIVAILVMIFMALEALGFINL